MGGTIGVESTVGVGSVFWFELASVSEPHLSTDGRDESASTRPRSHRGALEHTLLCIEDNPANLKLVEQIIGRDPNVRLLSAMDGASGIETAREFQPDAILMDINLPDMSGIDALEILRADPVTAHIPAVAVSANAMQRDIKKGLEAGFFRYITKPINVDEFTEALDLVLESSQVHSTADRKVNSLES
jgi:CheY-like chemotaxis protein